MLYFTGIFEFNKINVVFSNLTNELKFNTYYIHLLLCTKEHQAKPCIFPLPTHIFS